VRIERVVSLFIGLIIIGWVVNAFFGSAGVEAVGVLLGGLLFNSFFSGKKIL